MQPIEDEAIIIKRIPTGEADLVVHLLSKDNGRFAAFAKHGQKSAKRFGRSLSALAHISFVAKSGKNNALARLEHAKLENSFSGLEKQLKNIYLASYFAEMSQFFTMEGENAKAMFELLHFFLSRLAKVEATPKHRIFFEVKLLLLNGLFPDVAEATQKSDAFFDPMALRFLYDMPPHETRNLLALGKETKYALMQLAQANLHEMSEIRMNETMAAESGALCRALLNAHLPQTSKTLALVDGAL